MYVPPDLPPALGEALAQVRALPTQTATGMAAGERASWLMGLRAMVDAAEAGFLEVLAAFDSDGDGDRLHAARSTAAWLRGAAHLAPGDASERVRLARALRQGLLVAPVTGMAAGAVTYDQTRAIARATVPLAPAQAPEAVATLTELARQADAGQVRVAGRHLRAVADPDGARVTLEADWSRRFLMMSPLLDGMVSLDGVLDAEGAATLAAALQPFARPCSPDDERSAAQRRADGLVDLARLALDHGRLPVTGGSRPHLEVLCPVGTLVEDAGLAPARLPQVPGGPGLLLPVAVDRIACDAAVSRVLLGPGSVPVDVGRAHRVFPPALRRALALRDGGCRFPSCGLPAAWTDAHHLVPWSRGGQTTRGNGLLLCRFHHRKVHEGGWSIVVLDPGLGSDGTLAFIGPDGQRLECRPPPLAA